MQVLKKINGLEFRLEVSTHAAMKPASLANESSLTTHTSAAKGWTTCHEY